MSNVEHTAPTDHSIELAASIVAAYVGHNALNVADLPKLIGDVHGAIVGLGGEPEPAPTERPEPAVSIRKSVTPDYLVCLEDGQKFKSLKRHLMTHHKLTPETYRAKWGLPRDYPMVSPNYSETRSSLAKASGLGKKVTSHKPTKR